MTPPPLTPLDVRTEVHKVEIAASDYIAHYRRADYFLSLCQQCGNYGTRYGCPPFEQDPLEVLKLYSHVQIWGIKVIPQVARQPLSSAHQLLAPTLNTMNQQLLKEEKRLSGAAFGFVGSCSYCAGAECARKRGLPCRHPDKVRPSLEAFGFDLSKTATDLLGIEMLWGKDGFLPAYLTLVCGLFY